MKLQLLSDLHLEAHPHWQPQPAPGAEVLVLAGDIGSYQTHSQLIDSDFGLGRFSPCTAGRRRYFLYPATTNTMDWTLTSLTRVCALPASAWA